MLVLEEQAAVETVGLTLLEMPELLIQEVVEEVVVKLGQLCMQAVQAALES
jgi:hypothetical protein